MAKGKRSAFYKAAKKSTAEPATMLKVHMAEKAAKQFNMKPYLMNRIAMRAPRLEAKLKAFKELKSYAKRQKAMNDIVNMLVKK